MSTLQETVLTVRPRLDEARGEFTRRCHGTSVERHGPGGKR